MTFHFNEGDPKRTKTAFELFAANQKLIETAITRAYIYPGPGQHQDMAFEDAKHAALKIYVREYLHFAKTPKTKKEVAEFNRIAAKIITITLKRDAIRKQERNELSWEDPATAQIPATEEMDLIERIDQEIKLDQLRAQLTPNERRVFDYHYRDELKDVEIARQMHISSPRVNAYRKQIAAKLAAFRKSE